MKDELKSKAIERMKEKQDSGELPLFSPEEIQEQWQEELMVLESIFAHDFEQKSDSLLVIKVHLLYDYYSTP